MSIGSILLFIYFICFIPLGLRLIEHLRITNIVKYEKYRILNDIINLEEIHNLTPREFELWCVFFMKKLGYKDVEITPAGPDGGKDIICKKDDAIVYVECKRYMPEENASYVINTPIVKKLVGAMVGDNVKHGIIITTGTVEETARQFTDTLNDDISIKIIDGEELVSLYNDSEQIDPKYSLQFNG